MSDPLDKLFGGRPGAAKQAKERMSRTYGAKDGQTVFDATVIKRKRKGSGKRTVAQRLLGGK